MSVVDEFDTGAVEGLQGPIAMRDPRFLALTAQDKLSLVNFFYSPVYQVVLKLFQGEVEKAETSHFKKWADKDLFERTGIFAVAMRIGFERVQDEIARQVEEFAAEVDFIKKKQELAGMPLEQQIEKQIQEG